MFLPLPIIAGCPASARRAYISSLSVFRKNLRENLGGVETCLGGPVVTIRSRQKILAGEILTAPLFLK